MNRPGPGSVHLHDNDNDGEGDQHLGLGQGTAPLLDACKALQEHAPAAIWALECQSQHFEASLTWLKGDGFLP